MIKHRIYKIALLIGGVALLSTSCKKFLDVNKTPNDLPDDKTRIEYTMTSAQYTLAYVLGNKYQEIGGFLAQYWTQLPSATQYYDYDRYSFDGSDGNREWSQIYAGALRDLKFVADKGIESGDSNYVAIAKILQAYTFQLISDVHGDVPFAEALQAQDLVLAPAYDKQSAVYDGCLKLINDGINFIGSEGSKVPGSDDAIFHGDMDQWHRFANTLKLKLALRQSNIRMSTTQTILADLSGADFLEADAAVPFFDKIGNKNPLYMSIIGVGVDNNVGSKTIGDVLNNWSDPRSGFFFELSSGGTVVGTPQGAAAAGGYPSTAPRSEVPATIIGATVPVILISASESYFLQAEAAEMLNPGDGRPFYETAVVTSMEYCKVDTTGLGLFESADYSWDSTTNHMDLIATQKWVSMCGLQNMESWIESRRTGIPAFAPSLASVLSGTALPQRIPYAADEETANSSFPGQKPITEKMWWAK